MLNEFALLKLQTTSGEELFVHTLPCLLAAKRARDHHLPAPADPPLQLLPATALPDTPPLHALLYHHHSHYRLAALSPLLLNAHHLLPNSQLLEAIQGAPSLAQGVHRWLSLAADSGVVLTSISKVTVLSANDSEIYYICQPSAVQQRVLPAAQKQVSPAAATTALKPTSLPLTNGSKWSADDHEQLKKLLLQYGYSRWKQIQRSSLSIGGKLENKPLA